MIFDDYSLFTFKSYVWGNKYDVIGAGATSLVYKAIDVVIKMLFFIIIRLKYYMYKKGFW
jgi:hypothetical protein